MLPETSISTKKRLESQGYVVNKATSIIDNDSTLPHGEQPKIFRRPTMRYGETGLRGGNSGSQPHLLDQERREDSEPESTKLAKKDTSCPSLRKIHILPGSPLYVEENKSAPHILAGEDEKQGLSKVETPENLPKKARLQYVDSDEEWVSDGSDDHPSRNQKSNETTRSISSDWNIPVDNTSNDVTISTPLDLNNQLLPHWNESQLAGRETTSPSLQDIPKESSFIKVANSRSGPSTDGDSHSQQNDGNRSSLSHETTQADTLSRSKVPVSPESKRRQIRTQEIESDKTRKHATDYRKKKGITISHKTSRSSEYGYSSSSESTSGYSRGVSDVWELIDESSSDSHPKVRTHRRHKTVRSDSEYTSDSRSTLSNFGSSSTSPESIDSPLISELSVSPFLAWPTTLEEEAGQKSSRRQMEKPTPGVETDGDLRTKLTLLAIESRICKTQLTRKDNSNVPGLVVYRSRDTTVEITHQPCPKRHLHEVDFDPTPRPDSQKLDLIHNELVFLRNTNKERNTELDFRNPLVLPGLAESSVPPASRTKGMGRRLLYWQMAKLHVEKDALVAGLRELVCQFVPLAFDHILIQRIWGSVETINKVCIFRSTCVQKQSKHLTLLRLSLPPVMRPSGTNKTRHPPLGSSGTSQTNLTYNFTKPRTWKRQLNSVALVLEEYPTRTFLVRLSICERPIRKLQQELMKLRLGTFIIGSYQNLSLRLKTKTRACLHLSKPFIGTPRYC